MGISLTQKFGCVTGDNSASPESKANGRPDPLTTSTPFPKQSLPSWVVTPIGFLLKKQAKAPRRNANLKFREWPSPKQCTLQYQREGLQPLVLGKERHWILFDHPRSLLAPSNFLQTGVRVVHVTHPETRTDHVSSGTLPATGGKAFLLTSVMPVPPTSPQTNNVPAYTSS